MEVGSVREKIIIALLIYKFGEANVDKDLPITKSEVDLKLFAEPISIKTITVKGKSLGGVKLIWTVDPQKARSFRNSYVPRCDMLLIQIKWDGIGSFSYIPLKTQIKIFEKLGRKRYIKLPKKGTNPRGVEITKEALELILKDSAIKSIEIFWRKTEIEYNMYKRWIEYWEKDDESFI